MTQDVAAKREHAATDAKEPRDWRRFMAVSTPKLIGLMALLAALAGCDKDAKICKTGEGVDPLMRWGACNGSCAGKDNAESCAAAKIHAAAACAFTVKQGKVNTSACKEACEAGDRASCEVK